MGNGWPRVRQAAARGERVPVTRRAPARGAEQLAAAAVGVGHAADHDARAVVCIKCAREDLRNAKKSNQLLLRLISLLEQEIEENEKKSK